MCVCVFFFFFFFFFLFFFFGGGVTKTKQSKKNITKTHVSTFIGPQQDRLVDLFCLSSRSSAMAPYLASLCYQSSKNNTLRQ